MKIGDKIRKVLDENPEIQQRRAQLRAIYYVFKHDKTVWPEWDKNSPGKTCLTQWTLDDGCRTVFSYIWFKPLCDYDLKGVKLEGTKLIDNLITKLTR